MPIVIPRRPDFESADLSEITAELKLDKRFVKLLWMRGIDTADKIKEYLYSSIENISSATELLNIEKAAEIIKAAVENGEKIVIYGDYDCDGIGGTAILYLTLQEMGAIVEYYIPNRHGEGYGLNLAAVDRIYEKHAPSLLITVDCGISSVKEVARAKHLGMKVVVTDHHECPVVLPDAVIVNPKLDKQYKHPLCGAGVVFRLCELLLGRENILKYLDICAVSTIADIVPLVGDNRIIVKYGLMLLSEKNCRKGLVELMKVAGIYEKNNISAGDIGFKVAPRLNAAGRLSTAYTALQLLLSESTEECAQLAAALDQENKKRQDACSDMTDEAFSMVAEVSLSSSYIIVLYKDGWEEGVLGIAASKVVEAFNRPVILLTKKGDFYKGSGRSIPGINLYNLLVECSENLVSFGGHSMAAGVSIHENDLSAFIDAANEYLYKYASVELFKKRLTYDELLSFSHIDNSLIENISMMRPFGIGNPTPLFLSAETKMEMGRLGRSPHIKEIRYKISIVGYHKYGYLQLLNNKNVEKSLLYTVEEDFFSGAVGLQCVLRDIWTSSQLHITPDDVLERYLDYFLLETPPTDFNYLDGTLKTLNEDSFCGKLYIAFSVNTYNEFMLKNQDCERILFTSDVLNPYNAIVLLPDKGFNYTYYEKLIFLEKPPSTLLYHIRKDFSGEIEWFDNDVCYSLVFYNVEESKLRQSYKEMVRALTGRKFFGLKYLYETARLLGYTFEYRFFVLSFYVFIELGLLYIDSNDIILRNSIKVSLADSEILKAFWKKRL